MIPMLTFYLIFGILLWMVWYAGVGGTMRVFAYIDLQVRYAGIKIQMWRMKRKLEKELGLPSTNFSSLIEDLKNDQ